MSDGTVYSTKQQLIDSITSKVYTNMTNEVSADDDQTSMLNIVETLYDKIENSIEHNSTINRNVDDAHDIDNISDVGLTSISDLDVTDNFVLKRFSGWVKSSISNLFTYFSEYPSTLTNKTISAVYNTITGLESSDIGDFEASVSSNTSVALNTAHSNGTGSDHSDVTANSVYRALGHVPLSYMASNNGVATLDASGKIPNAQLPSFMTYKGIWNPTTNVPTLADGVGDNGDVYKASTVGTFDFGSGDIDFEEGDWVIYNGTIWEKSTNSDLVVSVNGQQGIVALDLEDIPETTGTKYFTSTNQTDLGTLSAGPTSNGDSLHTHDSKADKLGTSTTQQQFRLLSTQALGNYARSDVAYAPNDTILLELLKLESELSIICTDYITLSPGNIIVGRYKKHLIGQKVSFLPGSYVFETTGETVRSQIDFGSSVELLGDVSFFCSNSNTNYTEIIFNYIFAESEYTLTNGGDSDYMFIKYSKFLNILFSGSDIEITNIYHGSASSMLDARNLILGDDITATLTVGGITVGDVIPSTTTQYEFDSLIIAPYVASILSSFSVSGTASSPFEVGYTYTTQFSTIGVTNDSEGNPPYNMNITGDGFLLGTARGEGFNNSDDPSTEQIARNTAGSEYWYLNGEDKNGNPLTQKSTSKTWYWRFKFGASSTVISDDSSAQTVYNAMQQSWLQSGKARTATTTADNENVSNSTYIMYNAIYGDLSGIIQDGATPVLGAFTKLGDFTVTNAEGVVTTYRVYKSNATGAFLTGTSLAIS